MKKHSYRGSTPQRRVNQKHNSETQLKVGVSLTTDSVRLLNKAANLAPEPSVKEIPWLAQSILSICYNANQLKLLLILKTAQEFHP